MPYEAQAPLSGEISDAFCLDRAVDLSHADVRYLASILASAKEQLAELESELALLRKAALDPDPTVWARIREDALAEQAKGGD